jgi:hypothetical protein
MMDMLSLQSFVIHSIGNDSGTNRTLCAAERPSLAVDSRRSAALQGAGQVLSKHGVSLHPLRARLAIDCRFINVKMPFSDLTERHY